MFSRSLGILIVSFVFCLVCHGGIIPSADDHGNDAQNATPILTERWTAGNIEEATDQDWFSFRADVGVEYVFSTGSVSLSGLSVNLIDVDGNTIIQEVASGPASIRSCTCPLDGTYFLRVVTLVPETGQYQIRVGTYGEHLERTRDLLRNDRSHAALLEFENLLKLKPDDPEANFYVAVLRFIDIVETPDSRLSDIFTVFGIQGDIVPVFGFSLASPLPESATDIAEIREYAAEVLVPTIEASLANLAKVAESTGSRILLTDSLYPGGEAFFVDTGDVHVLKGGLLVLKSMILGLDGFNLDVNAKVIEDMNNREPLSPWDYQTFLQEYPDLGRANSSGSTRLREALESWLQGSGEIREGIAFKLGLPGPSYDSMFSISQEDGGYALQILEMMDRVFESLLAVTGGDFDNNGKVDEQDFFLLQALWHRPSRVDR